jgi:hypothetical protein
MHLYRIQPSIALKITFLLAGSFALYFSNLYGQNDCTAKIQEAQKFYDLGMIEEIPQMLAPCLEEGFTRTQKIEAYKLIILSYLFDDDQFEAEKTMVEFLKKYPEYEIMPNDPIEFVYLFESYRTTSVFSIGFTAGFNLTDPRIIEPYTVLDLSNTKTKNSMKPGFNLGIGFGRYINRKLLLNLEFNFVSNNYSFSDEINMSHGEIQAVNYVTYAERLNKLELPLSVTYEFTIKNIHYFIRTGFSVAKLIGCTGSPVRKYSEELPPESGGDQDISSFRRNLLFGGIIGAGIRYKVPRGVLTVDLRANIGLNNIVKTDRRYQNQKLLTKYYYLDDDFSINTFSLSAGYYFSFYKPKKQR